MPSLLLCRDLLDHLGNRARVNGTKADSKLSASWKHWLCAYDILFFDWQVSCDGIWWVDGLVCLAFLKEEFEERMIVEVCVREGATWKLSTYPDLHPQLVGRDSES